MCLMSPHQNFRYSKPEYFFNFVVDVDCSYKGSPWSATTDNSNLKSVRVKEQAKKCTQLFGPQKLNASGLLNYWLDGRLRLFGTSALFLSACTVFKERMDSITPVALTAHHTPNLMYCLAPHT